MIRQVIAIHDLHCTMCSMTIDGVLEDLTGVMAASTSFARSQTQDV